MKLERICEMAEAELEELMSNGKFRTATDVDNAYKLTTIVKNIKKIMSSGYSNDGNSNRSRASYNSYDGSYDGDSYEGSNASYRRRDARGRYSRDGYSRHGEMVQKLKAMLGEAEGTEREALERCISHIEG